MSTATATSRRKQKSSLLTGSKVWFIAAAAIAVLVVIGVFLILSQLTQTTTYYVLNRDVPARSQITAEMLTPVTTAEGGEPRNALDIGDVQVTYTAAKYALQTGDILTASNTGALDPISQGIPSDYVVASFAAPAESAVAGKLARGNYIDIIASSGDGSTDGSAVAKYVLRHVLVLDVAADLAVEDAAASTGAVDANGVPVSAAESDAVRSGVPSLYTVALPPADAAKLALVSASPLLVVLSASEFDADADISVNQGDVFAPGPVGDSGAGTDPAFGAGTEEGATTEDGAVAIEEEPVE